MLKYFAPFVLASFAIVSATAQDEKDNPTPKGVTVTVDFPKEMTLTKAKAPGSVTAHFKVVIKIKNDGTEGAPFSRADLGVKAKGLAAPQIRVEDTGRDALLIEAGKTHATERKIEFSMFVPGAGKTYDVEVKVFDKWYKGKIAAQK